MKTGVACMTIGMAGVGIATEAVPAQLALVVGAVIAVLNLALAGTLALIAVLSTRKHRRDAAVRVLTLLFR